MKTLLNTSFFCSPTVEREVMATLRQRWIPACNAAGVAPAMLLRMPPEEGIIRFAVQTPFADAAAAEAMRSEVLDAIGAELTRKLGAENYTHFSTLMEILPITNS